MVLLFPSNLSLTFPLAVKLRVQNLYPAKDCRIKMLLALFVARLCCVVNLIPREGGEKYAQG